MAVLGKINTVFLLSEKSLEFLNSDFDSPRKTQFPPNVLENGQVINKIRLEELVVEFIDEYSDKKRNSILVISELFAKNTELINTLVKILEDFNWRVFSVVSVSVFRSRKSSKDTITNVYNKVLDNPKLVKNKNILVFKKSFISNLLGLL